MYEYVPTSVATNPPILVVSHYCGGSASGVFGEAQGGGIVAAADKYGFIMIYPQTSNNCWDVGSSASLTHNGGGDTQAIAEMVTYSLGKHNGDASRVYAVGTSSGAMMTEALLAVYPEVFKGGAEFSGVPAGCWAVNYSASNQWSGPCASGQVMHTAQEWGDMVRTMEPGYSGYRPRIQLWHGESDPTINYNNQTEAIKEWTNVLGLSASPTSTSSVSLNSHQWTHQSWQNACGFTVLDAWSEQNGPHGTDANLNAMYVIPFLGLDKSGPVDPEVAQCGDGGAPGGSSSSGGGGSSSGGHSEGGAGGSGGSSSGGDGGGSGGSSSGSSTSSSGGTSSSTSSSSSSSGAKTGSSSGGTGPSGGDSGGDATDAAGGGQTGSASAGCACHPTGGPDSGGLLAVGGIAVGVVWTRRRGHKARSAARS
jgi:poly(hydroxyalkanoate) depolymerase family esterase